MNGGAKIIVSVDTEEEGLWGEKFSAYNNTTKNLKGLSRFQENCEILGVPPTYLIDAPVLDDKQAIDLLKQWWSRDLCEIGAHCHAWCNPPFSDTPPTSENSYLCNLDPELQYQKLKWLTDSISQAFNREPRSYRAGRYGFDIVTAKILAQLGYIVDSSILPMYDYSIQGGPNFSLADPYPTNFGKEYNHLVELPITSGFTWGCYYRQQKAWLRLRRAPWTRLRMAGITDRMNLVRRLKLTPEGTRLADLKKLVDQSVKQGRTTLVLMLHSSSLVSGCSPYAKSETMLENLYGRFKAIVRYAIDKHQATPMTLSDAAKTHLSSLNRTGR